MENISIMNSLVEKISGNVQLLNGWVLMLGGYQYEVGITGCWLPTWPARNLFCGLT